eukprot:scaffold3846_cov108-Amphora_coffeaeformis.AAC.5
MTSGMIPYTSTPNPWSSLLYGRSMVPYTIPRLAVHDEDATRMTHNSGPKNYPHMVPSFGAIQTIPDINQVDSSLFY